MPIIIRLDVMLARRKMNLLELAEMVDIHASNLGLLRAGKIKGVKLSTLEALCTILDCDIADILELHKVPNKYIKTGKPKTD